MSAKYKSPSFLLPNELNTSANPANDTGVNSLYSMDFDGSSVVQVDDFQLTNNIDTCSYSAWVNIDSSATGVKGIFGKGKSGASFEFNVRYYAAGTNLLIIMINGTTVFQNSSLSISTDAWHHIAVVIDRNLSAGSNIKLFFDSVEITNEVSISFAQFTSTSYPLYIGAESNTATSPRLNWSGKIDEVAIFNKALNSTEIAALYDGTGSNIRPSNLMATNLNPIAYYPLGEQAQMQGYLGNEASSEWQFPNGVLQDYVMDFDGVNDFIDLGNSSSLQITSKLSISAWFKIDNSSSNTYFNIITKWISGDAAWSSYVTKSTGILSFWISTNGSNQLQIHSTTNVNDGNWHHFLGINDGPNTKLYIDGNLEATGTGGTIYNSTQNVLIGKTNQNSFLFSGEISNVAIWNTDQSTNKDNIYNNGSPQTSYTVSPQNWWKLNADSVYTPSAPNYTKALSFDGTNDYIDVTPSSTLAPNTGDFTFSGWFYRDSSSSGTPVYFEKGAAYPGNGILVRDSGATGLIEVYYNAFGPIQFSNLTSYNTSNAWHHIALVYNESGNTLTAYVDGNSEQKSATTTLNVTDSIFIIGKRQNDTSYWLGKISNNAIFNSALTSSQVSTLFNFGTPETNISFNPQAWWKLDDQNAITDSSGNGNTGTNNGATDATTSVAVVPSWKIPSALTVPTVNTTSAINIGTAGTNPGPIGLNPYFDFDLSSVTTTSLWIKPPASGSVQQGTILGNNGATGGATVDSTILLAWRGSSVAPYNKVIETYDYGWLGNKVVSNSFSNDFWYGNWHHILMIRNNQNVSFFIDGVSAGGGTFASSQSTTPVNVNAIGGALSNWYFQNGEISNLAIWNSDQSSNVSNIYNSGQPQSSYTVTPNHLFKLDNLTTGINDVYSSSAGTATSGVTKVDTNVYVGNIPVNGVSTTLPSTALQQSDLQFDSPYSNYSLSFDGTGDYIDCTDNDMFSFGNGTTDSPFSVSMWVNFSNLTTNCLYSKRNTNTDQEYGITQNSSSIEFLIRRNLGGDGYAYVTCNTSLSTGVWYHVVTTYDGSGGSSAINGMKIYVDGVENTQVGATSNYTAMSNTSYPFRIGKLETSSSTYDLNGKVDETAIFNTELTSAQVLEIYNNGKPKDLTTFSGTAPISWWRLGENAYFDNNSFVVPNSISGAPNGTGSGTITTMISADAPGTYANGVGANLDIIDRVGDAALSIANSQSYNIIPSDISPYVPQYVGDQIANNYSMSFDGVDDYFNAGNPTELQLTGAFSVSLWMKTNVTGSRAFVSKDNNTSNPRGFSVEISNSAPGGWFVVYNGTTAYGVYVYSSDANYVNIRDNNWHHIVAVYTPSTSVALFVDGNFVKSNTTNIPASVNFVNNNLNIGRRPQSGGINYYQGELDEVAIFDTALNAGQIYNDIYQPTSTATNKTADLVNNPNLPNPVAWYRMGD